MTQPNSSHPSEDPAVTEAFRELARAQELSSAQGRYTLKVWHLVVLFAGLSLLPFIVALAK